jgi:3-isopropylmalate dehydrogenase
MRQAIRCRKRRWANVSLGKRCSSAPSAGRNGATRPPPCGPSKGLLKLRKSLGAFANIRPVKVFPALAAASPLKPERVKDVDIVFVRELTGGIYFGSPQGREMTADGRSGHDTMRYNEKEIARVLRVGFRLAQQRRGKLTSVDKANVLASSRVWREVAHEVARSSPTLPTRISSSTPWRCI